MELSGCHHVMAEEITETGRHIIGPCLNCNMSPINVLGEMDHVIRYTTSALDDSMGRVEELNEQIRIMKEHHGE